MKDKSSIVLGFYPQLSSAEPVIESLQSKGYNKIAWIWKDKEGRQCVRTPKRPYGIIFLICLVLSLIVLYYGLDILNFVSSLLLSTPLLLSLFYFLVDWRVPRSIINKYKDLTVTDEVLLIALSKPRQAAEVLNLFRNVKSGHPLTYLIRPEKLREDKTISFTKEPLSEEALKKFAIESAKTKHLIKGGGSSRVPLLERLKRSQEIINFLRHDVAEGEHIEQAMTLSAEWLLDNTYVIQGSIEEIQKNLPKKFYKELPKIPEGPMEGLPRCYAVAIDLINGTAGKLTRRNICDFLLSYQTVSPLTIGELWALPLMLRIRLIEWIQFLATRIDRRLREGELADFWGNRLLQAARLDPDQLPAFFKILAEDTPSPSSHFAREFVDHLFDEQAVVPEAKRWLEHEFNESLGEVVRREQMQEAAEQIAFASAISSLITLNQIAWQDIFEEVSHVDAILNADPSGIYSNMDFATRNQYRTEIEKLSKGSKFKETEVAEITLNQSMENEGEIERHVGYYLIDKGRGELEKILNYSPTFQTSLRRLIIDYPASFYIGSIALLTGIIFAEIYSYSPLFALLSLLPISEIVIQFLNLALVKFLPPWTLPKMDFKNGIPNEGRTLVVVPMLLSSIQAIQDEIEGLEIRYLANNDPNIQFALFSDYNDSAKKDDESDRIYLEEAIKGIERLQQKYGVDRFFLFHREREYSRSEKAWIGWERKRGKLETLNRFLMGEEVKPNILYYGSKEKLQDIRFVITLDSDTSLPKDQANRLIEVMCHPLNKPVVKDRTLLRGYTLIQPRVGTDFLNSLSTWFSKIFSEPASMDPYTQAISSVYQDLTGEGTYHGKGIYNVKAFYEILNKRFPEEHLLSHDLLEGAFVKTGFASDICLFDFFPENYSTWATRQSRWIRGDLQIIDWILPYVPTLSGYEKNPLSAINIFKIFDNVRRALLPIFLAALLILSWFISSHAVFFTLLALFILFTPTLIQLLSNISQVAFFNSPLSIEDLVRGVIRSIIKTSLLLHEAYITLLAFFKVLYRRCISGRYLLEWRRAKVNATWPHLLWSPVLALFIQYKVYTDSPDNFWLAAPFTALWALAPAMIFFLDKTREKRTDQGLIQKDRELLRRLARRTWRYFDEFVAKSTHFLPPDNYQTALKTELAERTSPTNIGMWFTALTSAYDLRYVTLDDLIAKSLSTLHEMKNLEKFEGHFLNWYDTRNLNPLYPRYISTVDSGNLLACLWTLETTLLEEINAPIVPRDAFQGLIDSASFLKEWIPVDRDPREQFEALKKIRMELDRALEKEDSYDLRDALKEVQAWEKIFDRYFSWITLTDRAVKETISLKWLAEGKLEEIIPADSADLKESLEKARWFAGEKLGEIKEIIEEIRNISDHMNLGFLYNKDRKVFAIGFNVDDRRLDNSYYDLLASEARIASLTAIAKGDVPIEHWWSLGRPYSKVKGRLVLLSWAGTMFEYLMPRLFNKQYSDSLLGQACDAVVSLQIEYGKQRGIPWGISEAAFSAIDLYRTYQYKSFGVPGIGLKRGLEDDLVVSPYSTALALSINPEAAIQNLKELMFKYRMYGQYGLYESIDFTRQHDQSGKRGVIVHAYMAHHQGMTLTSINNFLSNNIMTTRYHNDPRIAGVESLLYERVPFVPALTDKNYRKELTLKRLEPFSVIPNLGFTETAESLTPKVNLLSNGRYSVMITNSGGGYSKFNGIDISRWRADTTKDLWGSFIYLRDTLSNEVWSSTFQPIQVKSDYYSAAFKTDKAEFRHKVYGIETVTEVVVSPEDNAEIRLVTIVNQTSEVRDIEATSYYELVLAPHKSDLAHPAFNKMFIETESIPDKNAIIAFRRLRSPDDKPYFAAHLVAGGDDKAIQFETDRYKFIGRGGTLNNPKALRESLTNSVGYVLDPIFSLRKKIVLEPGHRIQLSFVTLIAESREGILNLIEKYREFNSSLRAVELAWTYAQLEMRHLRVHQEEIQLFQKLSSRILFPQPQLRASPERIKENKLGQKGLWAHGISGDLPLVVVIIGDLYEIDFVKEVLTAHVFWSSRDLKVDLVILNEEKTSYEHPLQSELERVIQSFSIPFDVSGGAFLRNREKLSSDDMTLILSSARAVLVAARGSLRQQLVTPVQVNKYPPPLKPSKRAKESVSAPLPFLELPYFNGLGGYTPDGRSYVIYLGPHQTTPAPWINVMANPQFGTIVSERGIGCSWFGNSQSNRLTPWSNDPVIDPIYDSLYIRDEELGTFWTPTPAPIRELDPYRIYHSQGWTRFEHHSHGIEQELTVFVPVDEKGGKPLRILKFELYNNTQKARKLTVTSFTEWVLGRNKEESEMHVVTDWDAESQALTAYNRFSPDYPNGLAFAASIPFASSFTGDRSEFIGRNNTMENPSAMQRKGLSGKIGAALDPCASLEVKVDIGPQERKTVYFVLGFAEDPSSMRSLVKEVRQKGAIEALFQTTKEWWDKTLGKVQVEIPDLSSQFALNAWLPYQNLSCRMWGRTGFYQSSGAFGFRDQLQDSMAIVYHLPQVAREQILNSAKHQFIEGDVLHWWHPPSGAGIRTRYSDDLLWLPYVTAHYIRVTGDLSVLEEKVPFLKAPLLTQDQHEVYLIPEVADEEGTILEHCRKAIEKGTTKGDHQLPLIGGGDWNDGFNRVGIEGKGESVWLGWFLSQVMSDFADVLFLAGEKEAAEGYLREAKRIVDHIDLESWDGEWYRRAYFDNGDPLGSKVCSEARIDSLSQSWAVINGKGVKERALQGIESAEKHLVLHERGVVRLLTPPFNQSVNNPGYIMGYPPGVRENGGQYTHGSLWLSLAFARAGNGNKAVDLLRMMHPTFHTHNREELEFYRIEPYVLPGDVYDLEGAIGRGGWSWYTGSSAWMWRIWIEEILGFKKRGETLHIDPCIPKEWERYKIKYLFQETLYEITVENPDHVMKGALSIEEDGKLLDNQIVQLSNDRKTHNIKVVIHNS